MTASTGNSSPGRTSGVFEPSGELTLGLLMLLLALGAGIVALGEMFRYSLGLPGHHGLVSFGKASRSEGKQNLACRPATTFLGAAAAAGLAAAIGTPPGQAWREGADQQAHRRAAQHPPQQLPAPRFRPSR